MCADKELTALDAAALRQARQNIGMVFQQFNLLSNRTVADNVAFPWKSPDGRLKKSKNALKECLEIVGLTERADHYPAQLSGGQKQRVGIARALAPKPQSSSPTNPLPPSTPLPRAASWNVWKTSTNASTLPSSS